MTTSPAVIVSYLLEQLNLVDGWAVRVSTEPEEPDDVITLFDTTPIIQGRLHRSGKTVQQFGIQIRLRSNQNYDVGYGKLMSISSALDQVKRQTVIIDGKTYLVHAFTHATGITPLREMETRQRLLFTLNLLTSIEEL